MNTHLALLSLIETRHSKFLVNFSPLVVTIMLSTATKGENVMARITTASALRALAEKILSTVNGATNDEPYFINLDTELTKIENS